MPLVPSLSTDAAGPARLGRPAPGAVGAARESAPGVAGGATANGRWRATRRLTRRLTRQITRPLTRPLTRPPAQSAEPEWMDGPGHSRALIDDNLDDLRRVNRLLGGRRLTLKPLERLAARVPATDRLRVLDVATGAADIPRAVTWWAAAHRRRAFVIASDVNLGVLCAGRDHEAVPPGLVFVAADATALPFRDGSVHVSTSSLALHHLSPDQALAALREQRRCALIGVVVNDVVRSWLAYFGAILAVRFGSSNRLTRHDGPVSVLRAFTVAELRILAHRAGLTPIEWDSFLFYRVAMTSVG